jgi:hypothetical protein
MLRFVATAIIELIASAFGLLVAKWLLPGFSITFGGFVFVVAIFTAARFLLAPLVFKLSFRYARVLTGGIALVTTFLGLLVTTWLTDGLAITGASTWVIATLIVWLFGVIAVLLLPLFVFKQALAKRSDGSPPPMR